MAKEEFMGTDGVNKNWSVYNFDEMTRYGFMSHMESFIKDLMENPLNAVPDEYLEQHGIDRITALRLLTKRTVPNDPNSAVLIRITKIKPETMEIEDLKGKKITKTGKDLYSVKYRMPKKDVNKKLRNLYIENFEEPIGEGIIGIDNGEYGHYIKEDGEGGVMGGATTSVSSGQYVQPMSSKPVRRALYITQEQNDFLRDKLNEESPAEVNTMFGDFGFDANGLKTKKSDSAFNHKEIFKKGGFNNVESR